MVVTMGKQYGVNKKMNKVKQRIMKKMCIGSTMAEMALDAYRELLQEHLRYYEKTKDGEGFKVIKKLLKEIEV